MPVECVFIDHFDMFGFEHWIDRGGCDAFEVLDERYLWWKPGVRVISLFEA